MTPYSQYMIDRTIEHALNDKERDEKLQMFQDFLGNCASPSFIHLPVGSKLTPAEIQTLEDESIVTFNEFETEYIQYCFLNDIDFDEIMNTMNKVRDLKD